MRRHVLPRRPGGAAGTPSRRTALPVGRGQAPPYAVTALPPSASLAASVRAHWREFSMEGAEIGSLMICICTAGVLLYSSASPIQSLALSSGTSAALMGTAVASATYVIIRSPFGRRSGAHLNPAVTLSFLWLGRIRHWDAAAYITSHFVGGAAGVLVARELFGTRLSEKSVQYLVTVPGVYGEGVAFLAELILSALFMGIVLFAANHRFLTRFSPLFVALVTVVYYAACPSISGFSVNPARSFASPLFASIWQGIWIYLLAPCLGMLMASRIYVAVMGRNGVYCAKVFHDLRSTCPFPCRFDRLVAGSPARY